MSKELKVGTFVLGTLLILIGAFWYLDQMGGVHLPYKAYFTYVGGVDPGSPVRFGGLKVGSITAIRGWSKDPTKVEVLMEIKQGTPVNADSVATLTSLSPLGDKYLEITTGSNKAQRLPPGSTIPSAESVSLDDLARQASALIPTIQATLQGVQKDVNQLTGNAGTVLANLQTMTGPQNQRNFTLLLANARELIDKESGQIDTLLRNLDRAAVQANGVMGQVSGVMGQVSGVMGQASGVMTQASGALNDFQMAAQTANGAFATANLAIGEMRDPMKADLAEMQRTMAEARRLISDLNTVVSSNQYSIDDTIDNFRAASENLRQLTLNLKQRPWTLLRGRATPDRPVPVVITKR